MTTMARFVPIRSAFNEFARPEPEASTMGSLVPMVDVYGDEGGVKQESFHRIERRFGSFVRSFTLPQAVDTEALTASYDAGVLTIAVAKKAEAKPRQVKIEVVSPDPAATGSAKTVETERIA
jgi:Hsp20/alpha crystallin family